MGGDAWRRRHAVHRVAGRGVRPGDEQPEKLDILVGMLLIALVAAAVGAALVGVIWWLT